jgi:tetratricopeptide (TPR) repeat protein
MIAPAGCADRETWRDVLEERVTAADRPRLLAHLDACPACAATFAELAGEWSLATLANEKRAVGEVTRGIRERLATVHSGAEPPRIPGLTDLELAGRGGMGAVYRGRDTRLGRLVAVKVLAGTGVLSDTARARAEREARVLAQLDHPHIVRIHSAGEADGLPYIVMEWIEGRTLQRRIDDGVLPPREAAEIAVLIARALVEVHDLGIVHRDLKPENVLLASGSGPKETELPKLVDFGLARPDDEELTRTTAVLGTPSYMAPEQTGLEPALGGLSPATDIHGLGAILYSMLAGRPPYDGASAGESLRRAAKADAVPLATVAPRVPADLRTIVETCLRYEPARRYATAAALADDLTRFLENRPIAARPAGPLARLRIWGRHHPAAAVAASLTAVLVMAAAGAAAYHVIRLDRAHATAAASRDAALAARDLARQSLERLTDDSIEGMLVRGPALGTKDREFLRSVRDEFRRWPLEPDVAAGLTFRARGLQRVANLFLQLDQVADALECQDAVLETLDEARRRGLGGDELAARRIDAFAGRRQLLYRLGRVGEATAAARAAVAELETTAAEDPTLQGRLAAALIDLAITEDANGNREAGLPLVDRALDMFAAAVQAAPDAPEPLQEEIRALYNASLLSLNAGRTAERHERLENLVTRCEEGRRRFPDQNAAWDRSLLLGLTGLADMELAADRSESALVLATSREATARAAWVAHPDNPLFLGECVDAAIQVSVCHESLGRPAESRAKLMAAVRLAETAVEREPAVHDRSRLLAMVLSRQARLFDLLGEPDAAVAARDRLAAVLAPWKDRAQVAGTIADHHVESSHVLTTQGDHRGAVDRLERALAVAPDDRKPDITARLDSIRTVFATASGTTP